MFGVVSHGWIEVVIGPMYSGKSEELIRRVRRAKIAKMKVQVFKPSVDDRYSKEDVVSHCGEKVEATPVKDSSEIMTRLENDTKVVAIDEVQFTTFQRVVVSPTAGLFPLYLDPVITTRWIGGAFKLRR